MTDSLSGQLGDQKDLKMMNIYYMREWKMQPLSENRIFYVVSGGRN